MRRILDELFDGGLVGLGESGPKSCAEVMRYLRFTENTKRLEKGLGVESRKPDGLGVTGQRGFDVHGYKVEVSVFDKLPQNIGAGAVGIEFDFVTKGADAEDELRKVGMKGGFAAGDNEGVKLPSARGEFLKNCFLRDGLRKLPGVDEGGIVAPRAAPVAALGKDDGGELSGIIAE